MAWAATLSSSFFRGLVSTSISPPPSISTHKQNPYHPIQSRAIPSIKNPTFIERNCKFLVHFSRKTDNASETELECIGTGLDVECVANPNDSEKELDSGLKEIGGERNEGENLGNGLELLGDLWEWAVLISPFFFWGTAMVAMKEVLPKVGPFFVASFRLIPAGLLLIGYARYKGRPMPSGFNAWLSITVFALVDATCFQGFLAEGLQKTSAGLGSVIIDSQPLTVAILAALLFGESIGYVGAAGLVLGVIGLLLLEVPVIISNGDGSDFSLWGSGEWWMLLAAQSMAIGTVMVRWVSKYSDPVMATGWAYQKCYNSKHYLIDRLKEELRKAEVRLEALRRRYIKLLQPE